MTLGRYAATPLKDALGKTHAALRSRVKGGGPSASCAPCASIGGVRASSIRRNPTAGFPKGKRELEPMPDPGWIATIGEAVGKPRAAAKVTLGLTQQGGVALGGDAKHFVWTTNCYSIPTTCGTPPIQFSQV
jgi:hypothetical protein